MILTKQEKEDLTAFPSVMNWSEKQHQQIQREPHSENKILERKLVRDVSKYPRTTAKILVNDLAKSGIVV